MAPTQQDSLELLKKRLGPADEQQIRALLNVPSRGGQRIRLDLQDEFK